VPIQVTCPSCNATLKTADSSAGKRAKCPKCAGVIDIPAMPAPPGDEYELEAPIGPATGFSDDELSGPAPGAEDRRPCPACGEMISKKAIKCRFCGEVLDRSMRGVITTPGDVSDPAWHKVRGGLGLMYYSIVTMLAAIILLVIGGMLMAGMAAAGGGGAGPPAAAVVVMMIAGLIIFGAAIATIVGQVRCASVPEESGARGYAVGAAACILGNIALSMIGGVMQSEPIQGVGSLLSMVGYILFILFIRRAADYLSDHDLAASAGKFLIFGIVVFIGAVAMGVAAAMAQAPALVGVLGLAVIVAGLVAFVWYLRLIKSLMSTIDSRLG
jgi:phage FluMu protein Com